VASFFSIFSRFLLTAVALLSSYSIHLLLKSSGIVGEPPASLQRGV
jgi:sodium-coupled neutral amino acid transporter 3